MTKLLENPRPADIRKVLAEYDIPYVSKVELIPHGADNTNLLVNSNTQRFVLRQYGRTAPGEVDFELEVIDYLASRGFPTPGIIRTVTGRLYTIFDARKAALFEFVEGRHGDGTSRADACEVAKTLARLHLKVRGFRPLGVRSRTDVNRIRNLEHAYHSSPTLRADSKIRKFLSAATASRHRVDQLKHTNNGLPEGIVHHDPNTTNTLFDAHGRLTALLDFDECHIGPFISDVAALVHYWASTSDEFGVSTESVLELVTSYQSVRPLGPAELAALPDVILLFYAADAAEYLTRELERRTPEELNIENCHSYLHYRALSEDNRWRSPFMKAQL